jgi:hypothetical protein
VSDVHDDDIDDADAAERIEPFERPDPRLRPPDPAGTQPQWNPEDLLPKETPRAASGRLWAPAGEAQDGGDGEPRDGETRRDAAAAAAGATAAGATAASGVTAAAAGASADASADDDAPRYSRYSARFQFLLGALLAVGVSAIALLVAVLVGGKDDNTIVLRDGPAWSAWRPTATSASDAAEQIAAHVGRQYKLPGGEQLVLVSGGPLEVAGLPVTIAIQQPAARGGDIDLVDDGAGVMYRLCGVGSTDCKIVKDKPSTNRHMLLRREALELALYSFRYLGVSETVVLLPPGVSKAKSPSTGKVVTKEAPATALLFRRGQPDVQAALAHPLAATLASHTPSVGGVTHSPDARAVRSITDTKTYRFKFQEANKDARAFLVLNPMGLR